MEADIKKLIEDNLAQMDTNLALSRKCLELSDMKRFDFYMRMVKMTADNLKDIVWEFTREELS